MSSRIKSCRGHMGWTFAAIFAVYILAFAVFGGVSTGKDCPMCSGSVGGWDKTQYLQSTSPEEEQVGGASYTAKMAREKDPGFLNMSDIKEKQQTTGVTKETDTSSPKTAPDRSEAAGRMLIAPSEVGRSDLVVDVDDMTSTYVDGSIFLPYTQFFDENNRLRSVDELAALLGNAGIARTDSVVLLGTDTDCPTCQDGQYAATLAYWMLKYLGHDQVWVLDGGIEAWKAAGLPVKSAAATRPATTYTPVLRPELLATYDFVANGGAQIVDARAFEDFGQGSIPGAVNIAYTEVLENGLLKDEAALAEVLGGLRKDVPVVVYANTEFKASMVWFALQMLGYDARIYTWPDWLMNQPTLNIDLDPSQTRAEPNPSAPGPVQIYAGFVPAAAATQEKPAATTQNNTTLTVQGCATCDPITLLAGGSLTKNKNPGTRLGAGVSSTFSCQAAVFDSAGEMAATVPMTQSADDLYVGTWDASAAPAGDYTVSFMASVAGVSKKFADALKITIT
ncbi:MAG: putative thiosulfate sulfurtransferase [Methanosaeta sp. PtaU1.Bin028]|nr:MAG: putative thiosulfate sulfurtransferase [Methanosaeta sp. PtaU1.Bin028]